MSLAAARSLEPTARPAQGGPRFLLIDGLRGLACLAVVVHHAVHSNTFTLTIRESLPLALDVVSSWGALGVQVFFVISGFVIAHSVRKLPIDSRGIGNFALRRQIRLDPPYWIVLAATLACALAESLLPGTVSDPLPGAASIVANAFYLHKILGEPGIVGVAWTLCIEVQFYLFFMFLLWCTKGQARLTAPILTLSAVLCAATKSFLIALGDSLFVAFWFSFALGVLAYWGVSESITHRWVFGLLVAIVAFDSQGGLVTNSGNAVWVAVAVTLLLLWAARKDALGRWSGGALIQYLGKISYSLYLVHLIIIQVVASFGFKLTHDNRVAAFGWVSLAVIISVCVAHLLHRFVERPSMDLASRLKQSALQDKVTERTVPLGTEADTAR